MTHLVELSDDSGGASRANATRAVVGQGLPPRLLDPRGLAGRVRRNSADSVVEQSLMTLGGAGTTRT